MFRPHLFVILILSLKSLVFAWSSGPWDAYVLAPQNRTLRAASVHTVQGNVTGGSTNSAVLSGINATITLDFGKQVGGFVSVSFGSGTQSLDTTFPTLGVAFSETELYVGLVSDQSNDGGIDSYLSFNADAGTNSSYTADPQHLRGGFRFLTLFALTNSIIEITDVTLAYTPAPSMNETELRDYNGYFYAEKDDFLNRVFYAGAHTVQLTTIGGHQGRLYNGAPAAGWDNSAVITPLNASDSVIVDGAKRDRTTWPGDLGIALESAFVSGNADAMTSVKNNLISLWDIQSSSGQFSWAGPPVASNGGLYTSDTYSIWTIIALHDYWVYSGDTAFIQSLWDKYLLAIQWIYNHIDNTSMFKIESTGDWGRSVVPSGHPISVNALAYRALQGAIELASVVRSSSGTWNSTAEALKSAVNAVLWDDVNGMYRDDDSGTTLLPQDGNTLAVLSGLADASRTARISLGLSKNWNQYGAVVPEASGTISPFITGFEVRSHFKAGNVSAALDIMRTTWSYAFDTWSNTSTIEVYASDGSLHFQNYRYDSYISLTHAWSTGPTTSLVFDYVGIYPDVGASVGNSTVRSVLDSAWVFAPGVDPNTVSGPVRGGFRTPRGNFEAQWVLTSAVPTIRYQANISSPTGSEGRVGIPLALLGNGTAELSLDGVVINGTSLTLQQDGRVWMSVGGGQHSISAKAVGSP